MNVTLSESRVIKRPIDEVRAQFCDMNYHAATNVHPDLTLTVHGVDGNICRFTQAVKLLGMPQIDEVVNTALPNGDLLTEVVGGTNPGTTIRFAFTPQGADATRVEATFSAPLQGARALIAPLFKLGASMTLRRAFEEDRRDLESGRYAAYRGSPPVSAAPV